MNDLAHLLAHLLARHLLRCQDMHALTCGAKPTELHVVSTRPCYKSTELDFRSDHKAVTVERSPYGPGVVRWAEITGVVRPALAEPEVAAAVAHGCEVWGWYCWGSRWSPRAKSTTQRAWERDLHDTGMAAMRAAEDAVWSALDRDVQIDLFEVTS